jgi:hypothetical protein
LVCLYAKAKHSSKEGTESLEKQRVKNGKGMEWGRQQWDGINTNHSGRECSFPQKGERGQAWI